MKILLFLFLFCTANCIAQDSDVIKDIVTGTTRTSTGDGVTVTNIDILLYGKQQLVGVAELDDKFSSKYLWNNVSRKQIIQTGRPNHTVFLYNGPYQYPSVKVEGKLIKTEKGYSAKDIQFCYTDSDDSESTRIEKVSGFIIRYGDSNHYLVSWTFKENLHDGDDSVFIGKLFGSMDVVEGLDAANKKVTYTSYHLSASNLKKVQVASFMKWWLSCISQPPAAE